MLNWLATLPLHHYDVAKGPLHETSPLACADKIVKDLQTAQEKSTTLVAEVKPPQSQNVCKV